MSLTPTELSLILLVGLLAGTLGGMLGIGGSVLMIPGLIVVFDDRDPTRLHLYQAAAMATNVAVAAPAAWRHRQAGTLRGDYVRWMLPSAAAAIVAGVLIANAVPALLLKRLFAAFLIYVAIGEIRKLVRGRPRIGSARPRVTPVRAGSVGGSMGLLAGLLGIGGGVLAVPLGQRLCGVTLREAIAASAAAMVITASIGATLKIATLPQHALAPAEALVIAVALAPTAILGSALGARLTHVLPLAIVRAALLVIVLLAAYRMSGVRLG